MTPRVWGLGLALAVLAVASGCPKTPIAPPPPTGSATPRPTPSWQPLPIPTGGAYSDAGIEIAGGTLVLQVAGNGLPVADAQVKVYGPTLALGVTNAQGTATLGPLQSGADYRVVVEASGYATHQAGNIAIEKDKATAVTLTLAPGTTVRGRVLSAGAPVEAAVVSDGLNTTLTDAEGRYQLVGLKPGNLVLSAAKPRFETASRTVSIASAGATGIDMTLESTAPTVYFEDSVAAGLSRASFSGLRAGLVERGWTVASAPPQGESGVWVLFSPVTPPDAAQRDRLKAFVSGGGKLVVFGEWGGFNGFRTPAANELAHPFGLHFNPDLVREPGTTGDPAWLDVRAFHPSARAVAGISSARLYMACSLFRLPPHMDLAQTAKAAYRVQANAVPGVQALIVGGAYAGGKAIAIGDASAWSDEDTNRNGVPNVREAENMKLAAQLFDW